MTGFHQLARAFWTSTSIKGVPRAIKSTSPLTRMFWGIATLGCFIMLLWQVTTLLIKYYMYVVAINAYDANDTPHFPHVVICNQNPYDLMAKFKMSYSQYLNILTDIRAQVELTPNALYANDSNMWRDLRSKRFYLSTQPSFPGTPPLPPNSSFVTDCNWFTWNWSIYNSGNGTDCLDAMQIIWTPNNNQCYIYKPPIDGLMGFSTIVYIDNFPTQIFNSFKMNLGVTITAGVRLYIYPNNTYPLIYFDGINISPGTEVTIKMAETQISHLSEPYSSCTHQQLLDPNDPDSPIYTQDACFTVCRQQQYVEICNCIVLYEAYTQKQQEAVNFTFCATKLLNTNGSDVFGRVIYPMCDIFLWGNNSLCDCPVPCTETIYDLETTIANWPNPPNQLAFYDTYIKPNPQIYDKKFDAYGALEKRSANMTTVEITDAIENIGLIERNFIQLNIRITTDNYRINKDIPAVGWETLFSNLGGTLNLWMGITVLFAAEVAEFIFHVVSVYFAKAIHHESGGEHHEKTTSGDRRESHASHGGMSHYTGDPYAESEPEENIVSPYDEVSMQSFNSHSEVIAHHFDPYDEVSMKSSSSRQDLKVDFAH